MHNFSNLFVKVLCMFRAGPLSIIRSISTLYTRSKYLSCLSHCTFPTQWVCAFYRTVLILVDSVSRCVGVLFLLNLQLNSVLCLSASTQSTIYCVTFIFLLLLLLLLLLILVVVFSALLAKCIYHFHQIHLLSSSISPTILYCVLAKLSVFESPF